MRKTTFFARVDSLEATAETILLSKSFYINLLHVCFIIQRSISNNGRGLRKKIWCLSVFFTYILGVRISRGHDFTSCAVLKRVEVERVDVTLGHNVGYRSSMSGLPILVLQCSREGGGTLKRLQTWLPREEEH